MKEISGIERIHVSNFQGCLIENYSRSVLNQRDPIKLVVFKDGTYSHYYPASVDKWFTLSINGPYFEGTFNYPYIEDSLGLRGLPEFFFEGGSFSFELKKENWKTDIFQPTSTKVFILDDFNLDLKTILLKGFGLDKKQNKTMLKPSTVAKLYDRFEDISIIIGIIKGTLALSDRPITETL